MESKAKEPIKRKLIYEEDIKTGEVKCSFEGEWGNSSVHRVQVKLPKYLRMYKQQLFEEAENGKEKSKK